MKTKKNGNDPFYSNNTFCNSHISTRNLLTTKTMSEYTIRQTEENDLESVMALYNYSRSLMRKDGNSSQWVNGYPSAELVKEDIRRGISHVITLDGEIAGVFVLIPGRDETYEVIEEGWWIDDTRPYSTIHRIARGPGRHGVFDACLEWSKRQATSIRIDTHADNRAMLHLLPKRGFDRRGIIHIADGTPRVAFQMLNTGALCQPLEKHIEDSIIPRYDGFDSAHRIEHVRSVVDNSMKLAEIYHADKNMVYTVAAYHDTGLVAGREVHHIESAKILLEDKTLPLWFSPEQIRTMAEAVEDHRASADNEPRSLYGKIVAEADRDIEPQKIIRRTVQYGLSNYPELDKESQWRRAKMHLNEKYGDHGYMKLWLPKSKNAEQLRELRRIINNETLLREAFEKCFKALNGDE